MGKTIIKEGWDTYENKVVPSSAGPVQREECRRAFYAGASSVLYGVLNNLTEGEEAEQEDFDLMESLKKEIETFVADVAGEINGKGN